jgi:hypothetical protein
VTDLVAPVVSDVVTPVVNSVVTPVVTDVVAPVVTDVLTPVLNSVVTPVVTDVVTPVVSSVVTPVVNDVLTPVANDVLTPVVNTIVTPLATPVANDVLTPVVNDVSSVVSPVATPVVSELAPSATGVVPAPVGGNLESAATSVVSAISQTAAPVVSSAGQDLVGQIAGAVGPVTHLISQTTEAATANQGTPDPAPRLQNQAREVVWDNAPAKESAEQSATAADTPLSNEPATLRLVNLESPQRFSFQTPEFLPPGIGSGALAPASVAGEGQDTPVVQAEDEAFAPEGADAAADCSPFDSVALQAAMSSVATGCVALEDLASMLTSMGLAPWLTALAIGLLALEYRRQRARRAQVGLVLALATDDATLPWTLGLGE